MKSNTLLLAATFIFLWMNSCKKDDKEAAAPITTTATPLAAGFIWQEDGGAVITADSAFWTTGGWGTGIRAYKSGMANYFEINWATQNNTSVGDKTLSSGSGFTFIKGSDTYGTSSAQNFKVTKFQNNLLSGKFNISVSGGTITSLSGTVTTISFK